MLTNTMQNIKSNIVVVLLWGMAVQMTYKLNRGHANDLLTTCVERSYINLTSVVPHTDFFYLGNATCTGDFTTWTTKIYLDIS